MTECKAEVIWKKTQQEQLAYMLQAGLLLPAIMPWRGCHSHQHPAGCGFSFHSTSSPAVPRLLAPPTSASTRVRLHAGRGAQARHGGPTPHCCGSRTAHSTLRCDGTCPCPPSAADESPSVVEPIPLPGSTNSHRPPICLPRFTPRFPKGAYNCWACCAGAEERNPLTCPKQN